MSSKFGKWGYPRPMEEASVETAERILRDKNCHGISCHKDNCPSSRVFDPDGEFCGLNQFYNRTTDKQMESKMVEEVMDVERYFPPKHLESFRRFLVNRNIGKSKGQL